MFDCKDCVCLEGGSGIVCQPKKCSQRTPARCEEDGTHLVTEVDPADPCCSISLCSKASWPGAGPGPSHDPLGPHCHAEAPCGQPLLGARRTWLSQRLWGSAGRPPAGAAREGGGTPRAPSPALSQVPLLCGQRGGSACGEPLLRRLPACRVQHQPVQRGAALVPPGIPGQEQDGGRKVLPRLLLWYVRPAGVAGCTGGLAVGSSALGVLLWTCPEPGLGQAAAQHGL